MTSMDIIGVGLSNMDLMAHVPDSFLTAHKLKKGQAKKVDDLSFARLRSDLEQYDAIPGGCAANTICGLAALGVSTRFFGKIGDDPFEGLYRSSFRDYGVAYDVVPAGIESSQCAVLITPDGERSFAYIDGASWTLSPADIPLADIRDAKMVVVEVYAFEFGQNSDTMKHIVEQCQMHKIPMVMKVMDADFGRKYAQKIEALAQAGILKLLVGNHDNLPGITQTDTLDSTIKILQSFPCDVLLSVNKNGAYYIANGAAKHYPITPVENPKNTAGAGDQFLAGFLFGKLDGKNVDDCMGFAAQYAKMILMHDTARPPLVNKHSIRF